MPPAVLPIKSVASVLTVASGGSAGYEGPVCLEVIGPEQTMQQAQAIASESYGYMNAILKLLNAR